MVPDCKYSPVPFWVCKERARWGVPVLHVFVEPQPDYIEFSWDAMHSMFIKELCADINMSSSSGSYRIRKVRSKSPTSSSAVGYL